MKDDEKALFGLDKKPEGKDEASKPAKKSGALATYFFRCGRGYLPMLGHSILAVIGACAKPPPCFRFLSLTNELDTHDMPAARADNGISIWAPTRYLDELGCSAVQAGLLIAIPNIADFCSQFILGAVDYVLTARGWTKMTLHRLNVGIGASLQALTLLVFAFSKSPAVATAAVCVNKVCHNMVGSWLSQGYMEIGGDDSGALKAYGTTACNLATMVLPCEPLNRQLWP